MKIKKGNELKFESIPLLKKLKTTKGSHYIKKFINNSQFICI